MGVPAEQFEIRSTGRASGKHPGTNFSIDLGEDEPSVVADTQLSTLHSLMWRRATLIPP